MAKNKKKISGTLYAIFLVAAFIAGLCLILYPSVSNYWNSKVQTKAIFNYEETLKTTDKETCRALIAQANDYNKQLSKIQSPLVNYNEIPDYNNILNLGGNGIMGYITLEKIQVELPIYHGTSAEVLNVAVGHLKGSSLPVGGTGTHCVLSAHRGLPSARLFTDLDKIDVGDIFTITVLDQILTYEVDQVLVVLPKDVGNLTADPEKDYCTLMTCTPYGINTHRLLVRGVRIETHNEKPSFYVSADAFSLNSLIVTPAVALPMLLALLIYLIIRYNKKQKNKKGKSYWDEGAAKGFATKNERTGQFRRND